MKLLSIAIPCYNSAAYMEHSIQTLLEGGEEVEILIVDDGSQKDDTPKIADEYAAKYPSIIKAIHKPNGGHGSAVNTGIENATGLYFKVVDSDDWVDSEAYKKVLDKLREYKDNPEGLDLLISNYVYEKVGETHKKIIEYSHILPVEKIFTWEDCKHFTKGHYILMHSVIFRTEMLRKSGVKLPEHTFYVDSIYVFEPLPYMKNIYYLNVDFYRYYIGREDQSVNEKVMISRYDQQLRVNRIMMEYLSKNKEEIKKHPRLFQYMKGYLEIITVISAILAIRSKDKNLRAQNKQLWQDLKAMDPELYRYIRWGFMGFVMNLPTPVGRGIASFGYKVCQKIFHFN